MLALLKFQESVLPYFCLLVYIKCLLDKIAFLKLCAKNDSFYNKIKTFMSKNTHYWLFLLNFSQLEPSLFCLDLIRQKI
jgi:hypothetical protein